MKVPKDMFPMFLSLLRDEEQEIEHDHDALTTLIEHEAPFERIGVAIYGNVSSSSIVVCDTENTARAVLHALRMAAHD
jgi:hypothetical protein